MNKKAVFKELQQIPGVGPSIAQDLWNLGIRSIQGLTSANPEALYEQLCALQGPTDRCMLYVFRCAVYYASTKDPDLELLKWWHWKG